MSVDAVATTDTQRIHAADASIIHPTGTLGVAYQVSHAAFTGDGFSVNVTTPYATQRAVYTLCLDGVLIRAGTFAKAIGAAPAAQSITTPRFRPKAVLFAGVNVPSIGSAQDQSRLTIGASDGTTQGTSAYADNNAVGTSVAKAVSFTSKAYAKLDSSAIATDAEASLTALTASGFDLSWTKNDAVATQVSYLAIGEQQHPLALQIGERLVPGSSGPTPIGKAHPIQLTVTDRLAPTAYGFGAIHPLTLTVTERSQPTATVLNKGNRLALTVKEALAPSADRIKKSHTLALTVLERAQPFSRQSKNHPLSLAVSERASPSASLLRVAHKLSLVVADRLATGGYVVALIPKPRPAGPNDTAGTVNLIRNPSVEVNTTDWFAVNGASAPERITTDAWDGIACASIACPGVAADEGVAVRTLQGLAYAGVEQVTWGQIRLKNPLPGTQTIADAAVWVRGRYSDGTTSDGERISGIVLNGSGVNGWQYVEMPAFFSDPTKTLVAADAMAVLATAGGARTFRADGAQIEEGRGQGPTAFTIGSYGGDLGMWTGATHLSPSIRQPLAMTIAASGHDGTVLVERWLYRSTYDNQWLEDLSAYVLSGEVSMSPERDVTWSLSATMTLEGWKKLTAFEDWLAPYMKVTYPDGTVKEGQLGLYVVLPPSSQERNEAGGTVAVDARDMLWLLADQELPGPLKVKAGTDKVRSAREIIDGAVLTSDIDGHRRFAIPDGQNNTKRDREFPQKTPYLEAANQMLTGAGMYPLWTTATGILTTAKRGRRRLKNSRPVRLWAAHLPEGTTVDRRIPAVSTLPSEITGAISLAPKGDSTNEFVLFNDAPHGWTHVAWHISDGRNPRARWYVVQNRPGPNDPGAGVKLRYRRKIRHLHHPLIDTNADAEEVAAAIAEEYSTKNQVVSFTALPDPSCDYVRETCLLALYDARGDAIALGQYAIHSIHFALGPGDYTMSVECGRVDSAADLLDLPDVVAA